MAETPDRLDMRLPRTLKPRREFACSPLPTGPCHVPVVIVGAGPIGLAAALDLGAQGIDCIVLEKHAVLSGGSRALCWAKRSLEYCDRLGVAGRMLGKGITWNVGKVFLGAGPEPLYQFDLLPNRAQKFPAFVNLQQYYLEEYLFEALPAPEAVRWQHAVAGLRQDSDRVVLDVGTPAGHYALSCDWLIAADGSRSTVRQLMGLEFEGRSFEDNFLIADIRMDSGFSAERRFWFDAPFNAGRTALMHQQPDGLWRLDFQLGRDIDREDAVREENVTRRVRAMVGPDQPFEYEWVSLYTFQCRRLGRFVHARVIFAGDAAHLVSPFGARGANGGLQDVDNLGWKLARVIRGELPASFLATYDEERLHAADENLRNSTRSTDFITPGTTVEAAFRDAALDLAAEHPFARAFVNSGRLSLPCHLRHSTLTTPDVDAFHGSLAPGDSCIDAPLDGPRGERWLLEQLGGRFVLLYFAGAGAPAPEVVAGALPPELELRVVDGTPLAQAGGERGEVFARYDATPGAAYLIRPDQHVAARWRTLDYAALTAALARAGGARHSH